MPLFNKNNGISRQRLFLQFVRRLVIYFGCLVMTVSFIRVILTSTSSSLFALITVTDAAFPAGSSSSPSSWTSSIIDESASSSMLLAAASSSSRGASMEKYIKKPMAMSSSSRFFENIKDNNEDSPDYAVFYNIYIPVESSNKTTNDSSDIDSDSAASASTSSNVQAALDIVNEQLDQVGSSWAATSARSSNNNNTTRRLTVYYNTIGNPNVLTIVEEHCTRLSNQIRCIHMQHYSHGTAYEEVTLQKTQEYCQVNNNHRVIYIHSKGTFHELDMNHHWRRSMTAAVTSQECLKSVLPTTTTTSANENNDTSCNVCGLSFQPVWTTFFAGNMWTANCHYIMQLLPIDQYQRRMQEHAKHVYDKHHHSQQLLETSIYLPRRMMDADFLGTGRYAAEHWVGSHYNLRPCDVSPTSDLAYWWSARTNHNSASASNSINSTGSSSGSFSNNNKDEQQLFAWAMAPRHALLGNPWLGIRGTVRQRKIRVRNFLFKQPLSVRIKEYTMLAGNIHKWLFLYNATPSASSWVWKFYPDAAFWQHALKKFGPRQGEEDILEKVALAVAQNESWTNQHLFAAVAATGTLSQGNEKSHARLVSNNRARILDDTGRSGQPASVGSSSTTTTRSAITNTMTNADTKSTFSFAKDNSNSNSPNYTIFYNIYIPDNSKQKAIDHALKIVRDQLGQVGASFAVQDALSKHQTVNLYYNTIGDRYAITNDFMNYHCSEQHDIRCIHMNHYDSAFEQVTLQKTHEYCQANPEHRVIYLHNKGSYHSHGQNNHWRRSLTSAATSEHCLSKRQPGGGGGVYTAANDTSLCNVCALQFHPIWTNFFAGNMFLADCQYIVKLLPPAQYEKKMRSLAKDVIFNHNFDIKIYNMKQMIKHDFWGVDRYADEHWIASHPDINPCDVSKTTKLGFWVSQEQPDAIKSLFHLDMAPRKKITGGHLWAGLNNRSSIGEVLKSHDTRMREYVLLPGILHRWYYLYNKAPAPSSWVWQWYPDGEYWLEQVTKYGANATRGTEKRHSNTIL